MIYCGNACFWREPVSCCRWRWVFTLFETPEPQALPLEPLSRSQAFTRNWLQWRASAFEHESGVSTRAQADWRSLNPWIQPSQASQSRVKTGSYSRARLDPPPEIGLQTKLWGSDRGQVRHSPEGRWRRLAETCSSYIKIDQGFRVFHRATLTLVTTASSLPAYFFIPWPHPFPILHNMISQRKKGFHPTETYSLYLELFKKEIVFFWLWWVCMCFCGGY